MKCNNKELTINTMKIIAQINLMFEIFKKICILNNLNF